MENLQQGALKAIIICKTKEYRRLWKL